MIIILGHATVSPQHLDEALRISQAHVARSRLEPGCLAHGVSRDADHPARLVFVEKWADMAAVQTHFAVPASREFAKALHKLSTEKNTIELYNSEIIII